ncbi:B12-binding domain-containing radical SAM protein [Candidatus Omnitrophota bacterium]
MRIAALNPWIHDFAAFDFWLKPYGFLVLLQYLADRGARIDFFDCLDATISRDIFGRGKYRAQVIPKPALLHSIPRYFKRYGRPLEEAEQFIAECIPDYILLTSSMTYWYPGIADLLALLKRHHPRVPVLLGGTYATLCNEHARKVLGLNDSFATKDLGSFFDILNVDYQPEQLFTTLPEYERFYQRLDYAVLRTSWGCPFNCSFCAIHHLAHELILVGEDKVLTFIEKYRRRGIRDFVFYDDALLYKKEYITAILRRIKQLDADLRFHTPNALHMRFLDREIAGLMKQTGFTNPHFGLETLNPGLQKAWGDKVTREEVTRGIALLKEAGFTAGQFSVYLLLGYPGQDLEELKEDVTFLHSQGARVSLAEFSVTPKTALFDQSSLDLSEPLLHNNSIFFSDRSHLLKEFYAVKNFTRTLNSKFSA